MANSRNPSVDSLDSVDEDPHDSAADSTSPLVVLSADNEDTPDIPFDFDSNDRNFEELDSSETDWLASSTISLSPFFVFLYLLSPFLTLGALFIPNARIPLKLGIPALCIFAGLSVFARYIWYMLAIYVHKITMEDIVVYAFIRTPRREGPAESLRSLVRTGNSVFRILLVAIYFKSSVDVLRPISSHKLLLLPSRIYLTVILALVTYPFCLSRSLAAIRVKISNGLSVFAYVLWLGCTAYVHATGGLDVNPSWTQMGSLWDGIAVIAFAFTASSTVSLYGSLKANHQHVRPKSDRMFESFGTLIFLSALVALALIMPLLFFVPSSPSPYVPLASPIPLRACLHAGTLLSSIPFVLVQSPSLPIPDVIRRHTNLPISRFVTYVVAVLISLLPSPLLIALSNVSLVSALFGTYLLPAIIHIIEHNFRRPLAIVMPPPSSIQPSASWEDELLQRKEHKMQRRRLFRRLVWDLGVWILVLTVGGGGFAWIGGRLLGNW